jgi:hypothetical protein
MASIVTHGLVNSPVANFPSSALPSSDPVQGAPALPSSAPVQSAPSSSNNQVHHTLPVLPDTERSRTRPLFSRRKILLGGVGIGVALCGAGIWYETSMKGAAFPAPAGSSTVTSSVPATRQAGVTEPAKIARASTPSNHATDAAASTSPASTPTTTQSGITAATPPASSSTTPASSSTTSATSGTTPAVPAATPTATPVPTQTARVTVQISSAPDPVHNGTTVSVSITTNPGSISVQLVVTYSSWKKGFTSAQQTTDGNGQATVSWSISIPPGQLKNAATATLVANASDQKGGQVTSSSVQVQVLP